MPPRTPVTCSQKFLNKIYTRCGHVAELSTKPRRHVPIELKCIHPKKCTVKTVHVYTAKTDVDSVRGNVCSNSKNVVVFFLDFEKNVKNVRIVSNHSASSTQLQKVGTGKSPTSNISLRNAHTRNYYETLTVYP